MKTATMRIPVADTEYREERKRERESETERESKHGVSQTGRLAKGARAVEGHKNGASGGKDLSNENVVDIFYNFLVVIYHCSQLAMQRAVHTAQARI